MRRGWGGNPNTTTFLISIAETHHQKTFEPPCEAATGFLRGPLSTKAYRNGQEQASAFVLVLPPERISNFEGQLTFDAAEVPFDELEYHQLVQRLGLYEGTNPRRGWWQWLRARLS